jgi:DNA-binding CsgD family transcriptional regulator
MVLRLRESAAETLQTLIGRTYDAAVDPTLWPAVLVPLGDFCHGGAVLYHEEPVEGGARVFAAANLDLTWKDAYEAYYSKIKPWRDQLVRTRVGEVVPPSAWLEERLYRKTEYYNDCLAPQGLYYHLFMKLVPEQKGYLAVALVRSRRADDFTAEERALGEALTPHLQRALRMSRHLHAAELQREAMLRGLEGLAVGVMLAAGDGRVLFANPVAEELLARGDGLAAPQQRLRAATPALTEELLRRIREAADLGAGAGPGAGEAGAFSLPARSGDRLSLLVCPFPIAAAGVVGPTVPVALVFVEGPEPMRTVRQDDLRRVYGLTAAEAKLVGALLAGTMLGDYAAASGISAETAKTQLRTVFAKTGQHRQADLIRHILANPILRLAPGEGASS